MFYTIYKITNILDGKIYIGKHQTNNIDDDYLGSGKHLKRAIQKHGIENFKKEILFTFSSEQEMNDKEAELVTEDFCSREDTYNICPGGKGGWGYINDNKLNTSLLQISAAKKNLLNINSSQSRELRSKTAKKIAEIKRNKNVPGPMLGKHHSDETKLKMSLLASKKVGELNSQFGSIWITDGLNNKKIKNNDTIPEGWYKGRNFHPNKKINAYRVWAGPST